MFQIQGRLKTIRKEAIRKWDSNPSNAVRIWFGCNPGIPTIRNPEHNPWSVIPQTRLTKKKQIRDKHEVFAMFGCIWEETAYREADLL